MKLLAIVPAYNEEASILNVCRQLESYGYEYIVINDCSTDSTRQVCLDNGLPFLDLPVHMGLTGGIQTGIRYAVKKGYDAVIQFDGDGQHDAAYIGPMLELAKDHDIVIGSRVLSGEKPEGLRAAAARVLAYMIRLKTGKKLTDPTCGMRIYGGGLLRRLASDMNFSPEPDTIAGLIKAGYSVSECPVSIRQRQAGTSYLSGLHSVMYMLRMSISILLLK